MAKLTKTRAREPLAEHGLSFGSHRNAQGLVFTLYVKAEETASGAARYYSLEITEKEAERLSSFVVQKIAEPA